MPDHRIDDEIKEVQRTILEHHTRMERQWRHWNQQERMKATYRMKILKQREDQLLLQALELTIKP